MASIKGIKEGTKNFFGSFFLNKYALGSAKHGFLGALIGCVLAYVLILFSLFGGYVWSFGGKYEGASTYRKTVHAAFDATGGITVDDGRALTDTVINTLDGYFAEVSFGGYEVFIDTRPCATTFAEFRPFYALSSDPNNKDKQIEVEQYDALDDAEKKKYSFAFERRGDAVDTRSGVDEYTSYFEALDDDKKVKYNALLEKQSEMSAQEFADELYILYTTTIYPEITRSDSYAKVPTLRTYYIAKIREMKTKKYFAVFDDCMYGAFVTDGGIEVDFTGEYSGLNGKAYSSGAADADKFISDVFSASYGVYLGSFFGSSLMLLVFIILSLVAVAVINFILCRVFDIEYGYAFLGSLNAVGSFALISGVIAGIAAIAFSFMCSWYSAYNISMFVFAGVMLARTAVLFGMRLYAAKKQKKDGAEAKSGEGV